MSNKQKLPSAASPFTILLEGSLKVRLKVMT